MAIAYNNLATISITHNFQTIANEISLLTRKTTMNDIQEYDLVALTEDAIAIYKKGLTLTSKALKFL